MILIEDSELRLRNLWLIIFHMKKKCQKLPKANKQCPKAKGFERVIQSVNTGVDCAHIDCCLALISMIMCGWHNCTKILSGHIQQLKDMISQPKQIKKYCFATYLKLSTNLAQYYNSEQLNCKRASFYLTFYIPPKSTQHVKSF